MSLFLLDFLDRPIAYNRVYRAITGKTVAALMLSQLVYWQRIVDSGHSEVTGWFYKTSQEIEEETGLSRHEQVTARNCLIKLKIIEIKKEGLPCRLFYRVDLDLLINTLKQYHTLKQYRQKSKNNQKKEEEERYIQTALKAAVPADPAAYAACIKKRLRQQGGLSQADKDQLAKWQEDAMPIPQLRPDDVVVYGDDHKITIKQVYEGGVDTDKGYLPVGPLLNDIKLGKAKIVR